MPSIDADVPAIEKNICPIYDVINFSTPIKRIKSKQRNQILAVVQGDFILVIVSKQVDIDHIPLLA